jgi:hypothetical protein
MIWLILCAALLLVDLALFSFNQYGWSLIILLVNGGLAYYFIPEVSTQIAATPTETLIYYGLTYLGAGLVTAFVKWFVHVRRIGSEIANLRGMYKHYKSPTDGTNTQNEYGRLANYILNRVDYSQHPTLYGFVRSEKSGTREIANINSMEDLVEFFVPSAKNQVDKITYWVIQWPLVIVDLILNDIIAKIGKHIAALINRMFGGISKFIIRSALGKVEPIPRVRPNEFDNVTTAE